jgi:hypothetical protein
MSVSGGMSPGSGCLRRLAVSADIDETGRHTAEFTTRPASTTDLPHRRAPLTVTIGELEVRIGIALMQHAA